MKKKLLATLVITIVILTTLFTCVSCSSGIFAKNGEREYKQVVATVNYDTMSKDIYRGQLLTYVYSYGASYQQNYGMSLEEVVEYFYNSLTQNALSTLYAKSYIYNAAKDEKSPVHSVYNYVDTTKSIASLDKNPASFLTLPEQVYAIETTNASLKDSYDKIYDELYAEKNAEEDETEEETKEEDTLAARTVRSYADTAATTFDKNTIAKSVAVVYGVDYRNVKYGDITKDFIETTLKTNVDEFMKSIVFTKQIEVKIKAEKDKDKKALMKSALTKLKSNIENNYMSVEQLVATQMDTTILQSYRENVKKNQTATDAEIEKKYNEDKKASIKSYLDKDAYKSALDGKTFTLANQSNKYVGVKSILLKFTDEQTNALNAVKAMYPSMDATVAKFRDAMALGLNHEYMDMFIADNKGIKVNVSNPFYNAEEDKLADAYTDKDVSFATVLAAMADGISNTTTEIVNKYKDSIGYDALSAQEQANFATKLAIVEENAKVEAFTQWLYLVNDDSGMFSSDSYLITPDGEETSYVPEYTVLARMLSNQTLGATTIDSYSTGTVDNLEVAYEGTTEVLKQSGASVELYTVADQKSDAKTKELSANVYTIKTAAGNTISFIVNDYGIHIIMVTEKYGCSNFVDNAVDTVDENGEITSNVDKIKGYVYNMNYIYEQGCTIKYDYTYTKATAYSAEEEYYIWAAGEFVKADIEAFAEGVTYYTRAWELQKVECEEKTYGKFVEETVTGYSSTNQLTKDQISILFAEVDDNLDNKYIIKNEKVYDKFLKEIQG